MIENYFQQVAELIAVSDIVHSSTLTYDKRSATIGFLRGDIYFLDGSLLHVREFVNVENGIDRYMYAYHYQRASEALVFRYDNSPHFPTVSTFPHHKHEFEEINVVASSGPDLRTILGEIRSFLSNLKL